MIRLLNATKTKILKTDHSSIKLTPHFLKQCTNTVDELPIALKYNSDTVEKDKYQILQGNYVLSNNISKETELFSLLLPPPNVTGTLHLGHALTATIQDALCRWKRMQGIPVVWVPGIDHAGIATQVMVEKYLHSSLGLKRREISQDQFISETWKWTKEKKQIIDHQLKQLGASLDWSREIFTLDPIPSEAVLESIIRLFDDKLLYRDETLVNWSCHLQSAISDIEVNYVPVNGPTEFKLPDYENPITFGVIHNFAYKFFESDGEIEVSTTRLETVLGDVAVAVHPDDIRYKGFENISLWHPFRKCKIPIIYDSEVDPNFGTGAVKITPGHNHMDLAIAKRHNLPILSVIGEDGHLTGICGDFVGLKRFETKKVLENELKKMKLWRSEREHSMQIPICSRSGDIIEYILKPQWFIRCKVLAEKAANAVKTEELIIEPKSHCKTWLTWLENIRDWCVSRQLCWGHRLPLYRTDYGWVAAKNIQEATLKASITFGREFKESQLQQDECVIDTWFSSALLPFSSFGWPNRTDDYEKLYPLTLMETGYDILFFWVARMVMLGLYFTGQLPFKKVILHGMLCDSQGKKMSKSLGNIISPETIINGATLKQLTDKIHEMHKLGTISNEELKRTLELQKKRFPGGIPKCGADAMRFSLISHNIKNHVIHFDVDECHQNLLFCNKIWQASRFVAIWINKFNISSFEIKDVKEIPQLWILSRLSHTVEAVDRALTTVDLHVGTLALKRFFYYDFCDIFVEVCKNKFRSVAGVEEEVIDSCKVLLYCLETWLRLTHPVMPFITHELYNNLPLLANKSIGQFTFPHSHTYSKWRNLRLEEELNLTKNIVNTIRGLSNQLKCKKIDTKVIIVSKHEPIVKKHEYLITTLAADSVEYCEKYNNKLSVVNTVEDHTEVHFLVTGNDLLDRYINQLNVKIERLTKQMNKIIESRAKNRKKVNEDIEIQNKAKIITIQEEINKLKLFVKLSEKSK